MKIIFYIKDRKLRSHAIKHLADTNEIDIFSRLSTDIRSSLNNIINNCDNIKDIGCPYFSQSKYSDPPCLSCKVYNQCSDYAKYIEEIYINLINGALAQGINIPRYACFHHNEKKLKYFLTIPDTKVIVRACYDGTHQAYNLVTCYCDYKKRWGDFLAFQKNKIYQEAIGRDFVILCTPDNWYPPR